MPDTAVLGSLTRIEQEAPGGAIANERFIRQLDELRQLKEFLFEEKVQFKEDDLDGIDLEELNNLSYKASGRVPSVGEWRTLDEKLSKLASYLNDDLRRKIRIHELKLFFRILPIGFLATTVVSTILYANLYLINSGSAWRAFLWLVIICAWSVSQGGLGACAFLGTSVIMKTSILTDTGPRENIDLTDRNFLVIRVILGTSFAVIIGLPYSPLGLNLIPNLYLKGTILPVDEYNFMLSLIPFLAGFSTNLVLVILGKFVGAIEGVFGSPGRT
jgi:hypothetical protein